MTFTIDTNVLVRAVVNDDVVQSPVARAILSDENVLILTIPMLCELVWVLRQGYRKSSEDIANVIRRLMSSANSVCDRQAVLAGLAMLNTGGDFADGAIAFEGRKLGAEMFVSFDKSAVQRLLAIGESARLP